MGAVTYPGVPHAVDGRLFSLSGGRAAHTPDRDTAGRGESASCRFVAPRGSRSVASSGADRRAPGRALVAPSSSSCAASSSPAYDRFAFDVAHVGSLDRW